MDIKIGDITSATSGIIAHGVNLQNVMGAGVARALYLKYPQVKSEYHKQFDSDIKPFLGGVNFVQINSDLLVANCFTQNYYGNDGRKYASTSAIEDALTRCAECAFVNGYYDLHIPRIGCDLGGLDWKSDVEPIVDYIQDIFIDRVNITVWEIDERKI